MRSFLLARESIFCRFSSESTLLSLTAPTPPQKKGQTKRSLKFLGMLLAKSFFNVFPWNASTIPQTQKRLQVGGRKTPEHICCRFPSSVLHAAGFLPLGAAHPRAQWRRKSTMEEVCVPHLTYCSFHQGYFSSLTEGFGT